MADLRPLTTAFAIGRVTYATLLLTHPRALAEPWVGPDARRGGTQVGMRGLGGRDLAASTALLWASRRGAPLRPWLLLCAAGDLGDAAATLLAHGDIPTAGLRKGVAVGAVTAAAGLVLAGLS